MAVAVAAWLADLSWPAVVGVMALALAIAWLVEWVSWREAQAARLASPPLIRHGAVEEPPPARPPEPVPEPEAPSVVEMASPAAEPVPEPVVVEADHDPVRVPPVAANEPEQAVPEPVEAEDPEPAAPEPAVPEPVEAAPETESGEIGEEPEPGESSRLDELEAPVARARRSWRGMTLRRVDPQDATTSGELPAPEEHDRAQYPERPATASELLSPVEGESRPEPEERPAYAPPRGVPRPQPDEVAPVAPRAPANVVRMPQSATPREWNLWELESLAREQARLEPERGEEWSYLFVHLRQFADVEGKLPSDFDGLVRESFGELLETLEPV